MDALVDEVDQSPDGPSVGAFFDFDGTLIYGFSAIALQVARLRRRDVSPQEVAHALITGVGLVLGQAEFEFFFAEKAGFVAEIEAELERTERPVTAPFLRPFLEAYWVMAEALRARGDEPVTDADTLLAESCGLGEQYLLQHRIYCADAVSSSYADGAIRLAEHRDLLAPAVGAGDLATRRAEFADELHTLVRRVRTTQIWAAQRFLEVMRGH